MRYIKVILTIIAALLALHLIKPVVVKEARGTNTTDINIVEIGGYRLTDRVLRVKIE